MRQRSPSYSTVREVALPPSRSTVSDSRGMATVSMSCRTVATLCSSRLSIVGGPSGPEGKNEGGLGAVPGMSSLRAAGNAPTDEGNGEGSPAAPDGGGEDGRTGGRGGVGCCGGMGRRGLLTQCQSMADCGRRAHADIERGASASRDDCQRLAPWRRLDEGAERGVRRGARRRRGGRHDRGGRRPGGRVLLESSVRADPAPAGARYRWRPRRCWGEPTRRTATTTRPGPRLPPACR